MTTATRSPISLPMADNSLTKPSLKNGIEEDRNKYQFIDENIPDFIVQIREAIYSNFVEPSQAEWEQVITKPYMYEEVKPKIEKERDLSAFDSDRNISRVKQNQ